ncbi:UNVERIFIED_ORG: murein DD-endopeptidase MepM/ murein hydrolase activator NlpD [Rhizobium sp. SLBN-170]
MLLSAAVVGPVWTALAQESCDLSPMVRPLATAKLDSYRITSIGINFNDTTISIPASDGITIPYRVALPSVKVTLDATSYPELVAQKLQAFSGKLPGGVDSTVHVQGTSTSNGAIVVKGDVTIEKWISMTGFECKWKSEWWGGYPECRETEWKTRVFDKAFPLHVDTRLASTTVYPVAGKPLSDEPVSSRTAYDPSKDVGAASSGAVDWHISNDIERFLFDALTWLGSALASKDFNNWNFEHEMPSLVGNEQVALDARNKLYPDDETLVYRDKASLVGTEGYRGLWQIFVDTLSFDDASSGYVTAGESPTFRLELTYKQDALTFSRRLRDNRKPDEIASDPFEYASFCSSSEARTKVSEYLDDIVNKIENRNDRKFSGTLEQLRREALSKFGTERAVKMILEKKYMELKEGDIYEGSFPNYSDLVNEPGVIMPWDSVDTLGNYFDITGDNRACLAKKAKALNRSENLLRPYQLFDGCRATGLTPEQDAIIDEASKIAILKSLNAFDGFTDPVKQPNYRGWYYCYQNPRICSGKDNIYWWQQPSKFNGRGGNHKGIDIFGDDMQGATDVFAVTSGTLIFNNRDPNGWGNALIIPFDKDNQSYFAVYAHLPATAQKLDGKKVKKGDSIGTTGCTGNAGDGAGNCNTHCLWSGQRRTDEHLHFEIIKRSDTGNESVDPIAVTNLSVASDNRSFRASCEKSGTVLANTSVHN